MKPFTLNIGRRLVDFCRPTVMAVVNVTPDSFYSASRALSDDEKLAEDVKRAVAGGAVFIDVGAVSTRPGADMPDEDEEMHRLQHALPIVRRHAPDAIISVDTFRSRVACRCVEEWGAQLINDVSGGNLDDNMFAEVARMRVPYILTHMRGVPQTMSELTDYSSAGGVVPGVIAELQHKVEHLFHLGLNDLIIDPGFGLAKTLDQNYEMLANLQVFETLGCPVLVGLSRKSMFTRLLGISADEALCATSVANALAVERGAAIIRVHDAAEANHTITIVEHALKS